MPISKTPQVAIDRIQDAVRRQQPWLDLSGLGLHEIPPELMNLWPDQLRYLETVLLNKNHISAIPHDLSKLVNLTELYISNNQIANISDSFSQLARLTKLYLKNNRITSIPTCFGQLSKLTELDLSGNHIAGIPDFLAQLSDLVLLYLDENEIKHIPVSIGQLTKLRQLDLSSNRITRIPDSIAQLEHLDSLILGQNHISDIPDSLSQLSNLKELFLWRNQIETIPDSLSQLFNLTSLVLSSNQIRVIPKGFENLSTLKSLALDDNQITHIPDILARLSKLENIFLRRNLINHIPDSLSQLANLQELDLWGNQIKTIPDSLSRFANLEELNLRDNHISHIPDSLAQLPNLKKLSLMYNEIDTVPRSICESQSLMELELYGNPLESPPPEICWMGIDALRDYFRQLDEQGSERIYEARLLIVGQPGAGKTSLRNKIIDENYQLQPEEASTQGIETSTLTFPVPNSDHTFSMHIWDFGGQEIQYATHQFFLTPRALYVLLGDDRRQNTLWDDWFDMIKLFGHNSPVLVVLNERNGNKVTNFDLNTWRDYVDGQFIVEQRDVDLGAQQLNRLRDIVHQIQTMICGLDHIGDELPALWPPIRQALRNHADNNHISLDQYRSICNQHGLEKENYQNQLLGYLRDLGEVLHFDEGDLRETVFLNPRWVLDAVYEALTDKTLQDKHGEFSRSWIYELWKSKGYKPEECRTLLALMRKDYFDICYETHRKDILIAPQLLPTQRPEFAWNPDANLLFRFTYAFKPRGLMARLIVRLHHLIHERIVWRNGVLLSEGGALALVRDYTTARKGLKVILIASAGPVLARIELMSTVRQALRLLHSQSFPKIAVTEEIPFQSERDEALSYNLLRQLHVRGTRTYDCEMRDTLVTVSVPMMLQGFENDIPDDREKRGPMHVTIKNEGPNIQIENSLQANPTLNQTVNQKANPQINVSNSAHANASSSTVFAIRQTWQALADTLAELHGDLVEIDQTAADEVEAVADKLDKVKPSQDSDEAKQAARGSLNKLKRLVSHLQDPEHKLGKAVKGLKDGADIVKDLAEKAGQAWTWYQGGS